MFLLLLALLTFSHNYVIPKEIEVKEKKKLCISRGGKTGWKFTAPGTFLTILYGKPEKISLILLLPDTEITATVQLIVNCTAIFYILSDEKECTYSFTVIEFVGLSRKQLKYTQGQGSCKHLKVLMSQSPTRGIPFKVRDIHALYIPQPE